MREWTGFFVGLLIVGAVLYAVKENDHAPVETIQKEVHVDVEFKAADAKTVYPRLPRDNLENPKRFFTVEELSKHDGTNANLPLLLCVLGEVYDVGTGSQHYAPNKGYSGFAARDASRAFVTGEYNATEVKGLDDLSGDQIKAVVEWRTFYRDHETYYFAGYLPGDYIDAKGRPTAHLKEVESRFKATVSMDVIKADVKNEFKQCNSRHEQKNSFFELWCDDTYHPKGAAPVYLHLTFPDDSVQGRCVCVTDELMEAGLHKNEAEASSEIFRNFVRYPQCAKDKQRCRLPKGTQPPAPTEKAPKKEAVSAIGKKAAEAAKASAETATTAEAGDDHSKDEPAVEARVPEQTETAQPEKQAEPATSEAAQDFPRPTDDRVGGTAKPEYWIVVYSREHDKNYFYNRATKEAAWQIPKDTPYWMEVADPVSKKMFWHNPVTKHTEWSLPLVEEEEL
ncbi:hypothetical protein DIPPA_18488 [Diplonema papillatum]|nr:hypothetical protein DIPPA_18488 [Diplonema papillatum]